MTLRPIRDLLSNDDLAALWDTPAIACRAASNLVPGLLFFTPTNRAVGHVADYGGEDWLRRLVRRGSLR